MSSMNPLPLQARPFDDQEDRHRHQIPIQVDDDDDDDDDDDEDGGYEDSDEDDEVVGGDENMDEVESSVHTSSRDHGNRVHTSSDNRVLVQPRRMSELTVSFEGEVYVFHSVTPEKVQAVLLLLGGPEIPIGVPSLDIAYHQNKRADGNTPRRANISRRVASLVRFREKRKERCFEKKIRYTCRKEVALRQHRKKGQFVSAKQSYTEGLSAASGWDPSQGNLKDDIIPRPEISLRKCQHCGTSENSTPAMRRGPAGPRTLCNACGLMWANKGTLRDLTKSGRNIPANQNDQEVKTLTKRTEIMSANPTEQGSPEDLKPLPFEFRNHSYRMDEQHIPEDLTKRLPTRAENHSTNHKEQLSMQVALFDVADVSTTKIETSIDPNEQRNY